MKYLTLLLTIALLACNTKVKPQENTEETVYFLIRHAEKDITNPSDRDPALTEEGTTRAKQWAEILAEHNVDYVYSTDFIRTRETARPTAENENIEIQLYDPGDIYSDEFLEKTKGKTTLIVGHSNSTPSLVNKIIGQNKYNELDESVYNKMYKIVISGDKIEDSELSY